ncbi:MAG: nuoG1, partial [Firmicutes bacterium]|nr:nuoG1 [Bacillota bacterium]
RGAEAMGVLPGPGGLATGEMLKAAAAGELKALYIAGANLLSTFPDRQVAEAALTNAFVVTTELFLNESAQLADVILPASSISEKTGTFTTLDGTVQAVKQAKKPAGICQQDGDILVALAAAMGAKLSGSPADTALEIAKLVGKLEPGVTLNGAPASLLRTADAQPAAPTPEGLLLVPITKLYAGTSTAKFDAEFNHVQPVPTAFFNPADAARFGLKAGEPVELTAVGAGIHLNVKVDRSVVPGTVQAIRSLSEAPVNLLTAGGATIVPVTVAKLAVEVAD